ncbi:MAG TPA: zf-HC2 domain-containing protein [Anaeromyxobacteraceae bacterium]|nr:zf-HC2 domain-containing protein [Anaeromyxobacteraceae bacterium]
MSAAIADELTCKELVELVTDYFEDRLTTAENRRLELHVCTCTGCRAYLAQMKAIVRAAGRLSEGDVSPRVREDLLRTFREWKRR